MANPERPPSKLQLANAKVAKLEAMLEAYESKEPDDSLRRRLAVALAQVEERGAEIGRLRDEIRKLEQKGTP